MIIIYGKKTARIGKYTYNQESCKNCKAFDINVRVLKNYFHIYYIPFFPSGVEAVVMTCNNCNKEIWDNALQAHFERISKTPFYYFSGPIIIAALALFIVFNGISGNKEKVKLVAAPKSGDVYTIKRIENNATTYYFLRLKEIKGDSVFAYHSNLEYHRHVSEFDKVDFFVKEEVLGFTKMELKEMLRKDEINTVYRSYSDYEGFNRVK